MANPTFLWAANRDSAKVVKKSVKSEAKSPETGQNFKTSYLGLGMAELRTLKGENNLLAISFQAKML